MGCAWNDVQRGSLNNFGRDQARYADRNDLIVITVQDKSWHIEPFEVFREISFRKSLNAFVDGFMPPRASPAARRSRADLEKPSRQADWRHRTVH